MELEIKEINKKEWSRRDLYNYFTKIMPTYFSLTVDIDVTEIVMYSKKNKITFFPVSLWLISKAVNEIPNFRLAQTKDKKVSLCSTKCLHYFNVADFTFQRNI